MARIVIIGGGVAGLATAYFLGQKLRPAAGEVLLLEREPHLASHSSALNAAILRSLSHDPVLCSLGYAGARFLLDPPEGFARVPLIRQSGLLLTADNAQGQATLAECMRAGGAQSGALKLSAAQVQSMAPHWQGPVQSALHLPLEGQIDIAELIAGFTRGARARGVEIRSGREVLQLLKRDQRVAGVELAGGERIDADTVVLAAGGWAGALGRQAGSQIELNPTRRHLLVTEASPAVNPNWPVLWNTGTDYYVRPESGGLLLCGCDIETVDPDRLGTDPDVMDRIAQLTARFLPSFADSGAAHFWSGIRTLTSDGRFAVGPDPDLPGLFWVAGLGGHGMVCGAPTGELAAHMLTATGTAADAGAPPSLARALAPSRLTSRKHVARNS